MIFEPIKNCDENVLQLPVKFKDQEPVERTLTLAKTGQCLHTSGFILDESLEHVHCKACKEALNPMWVLRRLANQETQYHVAAARYQEEMQRLSERSRTKCEHCNKMTRISRS